MTAVEWLIEQMKNGNFNSTHTKGRWSITYPADMGSPLEIAKQMEKMQIIEAYGVGADCDNEWAKDYYNEKYIK